MSRSDEWIDQPPPENGRTRSASAVQEKAVGKEVDVAAGEVPIPWRTSRRLQEATFKSLQERDSGLNKSNVINVKKEKESCSPVSVCTRSLRRQHLSSETLTEPKEVCEKKIISAPLNSAGRKRRRRVHFGNPLFIHIEEQKQNPSASSTTTTTSTSSTTSSKLVSARKSQSQRGQILQARQTRNVGVQQQQQQKQPLSCFDLLCNHVGTKGWRCYRACLEGEAFCSNHMNRATSLARISVCT